jgi:hypothetical protein
MLEKRILGMNQGTDARLPDGTDARLPDGSGANSR